MKLVLITLIIILLSSPNVGSRCLCVLDPFDRTMVDVIKKYDAVFAGEVTELTDCGAFSEAKFKVSEFWKGVESKEVVVVRFGSKGLSEEYEFKRGEKYLVYAVSYENHLGTNACTPTKKLDCADYDVEQLNKKKL